MTEFDNLWWSPDAKPGERHRLMAEVIRRLDNSQYAWRNRDLEHGRAYDPTCSLMGTEIDVDILEDDRPIENLICAGVDTQAAQLTRDRPRVAVVVDGADFEVQENAKGIEKLLAAEVRRLEVYRKRYEQIRDAGVWGTGIVKIAEDEDEPVPAIERTLKDELVVDEEEARLYPPRCMYQRRFVDRWVLIHRFPKWKKQILEANPTGFWCDYRKMSRHQLALLEGWHIPSGKGAKDGRRLLCIEGADLVDEPWTKPYFPFLPWNWSPRLTGFWGRGLAEQGLPVQARVDRHDRFIAISQDKIAVGKVFVTKGSGVTTSMDNRLGAIIEYTGNIPVFETPPAVSPEIYRDRADKRAMFFETLGISSLAASAKLPANFQGGDSQPALREYRDQSSARHAPQDQSAEDLLIAYGDRILDVIEDIAARQKGSYRSTYITPETREEIDWGVVKVARDRFALVLQAANGLSRTVAGRRQEVEEDYAAGTITKDEYRKARDLPDISSERAIEGAILELTDATISGIVRDRPMSEIGPEGHADDLEFMVRRIGLKRSYLKAHRAKPDLLERFDIWIEQAQFLIDQARSGAAPGPAPGAPVVPPQALPGTQPGPQLVPNAAPAAQMPPMPGGGAPPAPPM